MYVSIEPAATMAFIELAGAGRWQGPYKIGEDGWGVHIQRKASRIEECRIIDIVNDSVLVLDDFTGKFVPAGKISYYLRKNQGINNKYIQWSLKKQKVVRKLLENLKNKIDSNIINDKINMVLEWYGERDKEQFGQQLVTKSDSPLALWRIANRMTASKAASTIAMNPAMYCRLEMGKYLSLNEHTLPKWNQRLFTLTGDEHMATKQLHWRYVKDNIEVVTPPLKKEPKLIPAIEVLLQACNDATFGWLANVAEQDKSIGAEKFMEIATGRRTPTEYELTWFNQFIEEPDRAKLESLFILPQ